MANAQQLRAFGSYIRALREDAGMKQEELAEAADRHLRSQVEDARTFGVSEQYISKIERAYAGPDRDPVTPADAVLEALAVVLGRPLFEFHAKLGRLPEIEYVTNPDTDRIARLYEGASPTARSIIENAAELAARLDREGAIVGRGGEEDEE